MTEGEHLSQECKDGSTSQQHTPDKRNLKGSTWSSLLMLKKKTDKNWRLFLIVKRHMKLEILTWYKHIDLSS